LNFSTDRTEPQDRKEALIMNQLIDPGVMKLGRATAEARGEPLWQYLEQLIISDYERETGRRVVVVFAPEPIDGEWEVVREKGESDASYASGVELVRLIMMAVRRT